MRLEWIYGMAIVSLAACSKSDGCPANATRHVTHKAEETITSCKLPDGTLEGAVVWRDLDGNEIGREEHHDGKLDGLVWHLSRDPSDPDHRVEATFRAGKLHGLARTWDRDGKLVEYCNYENGHVEGLCIKGSERRQIDHGRRAGWWSLQGVETKIYGSNGVLLAVDGHPVPLPPASIAIDGRLVWRDRCPPVHTREGYACADLFEDYQRCELKPEEKRKSCRTSARRVYGVVRGG